MSAKENTPIEDLKSAINWKYINTQLEAFEPLIEQQYRTSKALQQRGNLKNEIIEHVAVLTRFRATVLSVFDDWLIQNEEKIEKASGYILSPLDYTTMNAEKAFQDIYKLLFMTETLLKWAQTEGPFSTLNNTRDPGAAWRG